MKENDTSANLIYAQRISELMLEKKGLAVKIIDVRKITTLTDFFIICTSESDPQSRAITNHIEEGMKKEGLKPWHIEGFQHLDWVLLDYINVVVHVFSAETREYYQFERLWADGNITEVQDIL